MNQFKKILLILIIFSYNNSNLTKLYSQSKEDIAFNNVYDEALKLYINSKYNESLVKIRSIIDSNKKSLDLRILAAQDYIALNQLSTAYSHIITALQFHPHNIGAVLYQLKILRLQSKFNKALNIANSEAHFLKNSPELNLEIAIIYYELNNKPYARDYIQKTLATDPSNYHAIYLDGLIYLKDKQVDIAEFRFRNALALKPIDKNLLIALYNNLALCLEIKAEILLSQNKTNNTEEIQTSKSFIKESQILYKKAKNILPESNIVTTNLERINKK